MSLVRSVLIFLFLFVHYTLSGEPGTDHFINKKAVYISGVTYQLSFRTDSGDDSSTVIFIEREGVILSKRELPVLDNKMTAPDVKFTESGTYRLFDEHHNFDQEIVVIPGWLSLLPPLIAIILALVTRQVLIALFAGVWIGATFIYDYNLFTGFLYSLTEYIAKAPADPERTSILIFSLTLGGMVGVISKSGGTQGIVEKLSRHASTARRGQIATWLMGVLIFFDDYANTLIVGNTMRPLTDRLKISREKLAYLVDSTAAPVANIAIISTWIGYELSLISSAFQTIGLKENAYIVFFKTIPFNYYPLFGLLFGFAIAFFGRDFFSMYRAEKRAASSEGLMRDGAVPLADINNAELSVREGAPLRWYNAFIPIAVVTLSTLLGLWFTGINNTQLSQQQIDSMGFIRFTSTIIGNADSFAVLMWAAFFGSIAAIILAVSQRILDLNESIMAWVGGVKSMVMAALILTMAWAIGNICADIQTADYVVSITGNLLSPHFLPLLSFSIAGVIAFATGTSWGTMAILTPIVIPLAYHLPAADPSLSEALKMEIFLSSIASILAGATFGDHCSPISDTTIMSSMASGADHIDHVRTQLPYALMVAAISMLFGYLPVGFGLHGWEALLAGGTVIIFIVRFLGKKAR
ncbi:MAG: Na+/H+ antiporter NhaC family protein [Calditrichaceae bacterium]